MITKYGTPKENVFSDLVCWALCENKEGTRFVTGMFRGPDNDSTLFPCSEISAFDGYLKKTEKN